MCLLFVGSFYAQPPAFGDPLYGSFRPLLGHKYIISCWVKEGHSQQLKSYGQAHIEVRFLNGTAQSGTTLSFLPKGNIIDGWQRIIGIVEIPAFAGLTDDPAIKILLVNGSNNVPAYFDDVRFYPYNGTLKSFVYDEQSQKLMAELDENNFATFYEYDLEGGLIRIKKETAKGIFTIKESRSATSNIQQ